MKKSLKYFSILLALVLVLTGCGKKDKKEEAKSSSSDDFAAAIEKTSNVKGFKMNLNADVKMSYQGTEIPMSIVMNGDVYSDLENPSAHMNMTMDMGALGGKQTMEMYTIVKDGQQYNYSNTNNAWEVEKQEFKKSEVNKDEILNKIKEAKGVEKVDSDKDGYTKYQVTVEASKINEALKSAGSITDSASNMEVKNDFKLDVYVKDGYVSIISIDLGDMVKDLLKSTGAEMDVTAKLTMEFSDFDKVSEITVPEDVVKNAKEGTSSNSVLNMFE